MATSYAARKVLITGADGFIGSHLTEALIAAGAAVTALAQYNSFDSHGWLDDLPEPVRDRLNLVRGDVRDAAVQGPFDAAYVLDVLHHIPREDQRPVLERQPERTSSRCAGWKTENTRFLHAPIVAQSSSELSANHRDQRLEDSRAESAQGRRRRHRRRLAGV